MCKFQVTVSTANEQQARTAKEKLEGMFVHASDLEIKEENKQIIAVVDDPSKQCNVLRIAGEVKDYFGMHPVMLPAVQLLRDAA